MRRFGLLLSLLVTSFFFVPTVESGGLDKPYSKGTFHKKGEKVFQKPVQGKSKGGGEFVTEVRLHITSMEVDEALSTDQFYVTFPTYNRRHPNSRFPRIQIEGSSNELRLSFQSQEERTQSFNWGLQSSPPGGAACRFIDCTQPVIPLRDLNPVEIRRSSTGCINADPLGIEEATITYTLDNGLRSTVHLENLWIPCLENPRGEIREVEITVRTGEGNSNSSNQSNVRPYILLQNSLKLPFSKNTGDEEGHTRKFTYSFYENNEDYRFWRNFLYNTQTELYNEMAFKGCIARHGWTEFARGNCEEPTAMLIRSDTDSFVDKYCQHFYDSRCRYPAKRLNSAFDSSDVNVVVRLDYQLGQTRIDQWYIEGVDINFSFYGATATVRPNFSLSYNASYSIPCFNASICSLSVDPAEVSSGEASTVTWDISGRPESVVYGLCNLPDEYGDQPLEGRESCLMIISGRNFILNPEWDCPEVTPHERRVGLTYEGINKSPYCMAQVTVLDGEEIEDDSGCRYTLNTNDETFPPITDDTNVEYMDAMGMTVRYWPNYGDCLGYWETCHPVKRVFNALTILKDREWTDYEAEIRDGVLIEDEYFYDFADRYINRLRLEGECNPSYNAINTGSRHVKLSKYLVYEAHPLVRASTIIHEAWHSYSDVSHVDCSDGSRDNHGGCDYAIDPMGAFGAKASFLSWIWGSCSNCPPLMRETARQWANATLDYNFYIDPDFRL